jgi:hypothetical protein
MNEEFMQSAWRKPPQPFSTQLRERLRQLDAQRAAAPRRRRVLQAVACAASLLLAVGLVTLPSVRAAAETFLDLFRVVNFVAVPVATERVAALQRGLDLPRMLGEQVHMVQAAGAPQSVATAQQAGTLSGITVHLPSWLPDGLTLQGIEVLGEQRWTVAASGQKLQQVLDTLSITDLTVPPGLDGQTATIHVYPSVRVSYSTQAAHVLFIQARQPEVPVPASVANFHEVDLGAGTGLLIETAATAGPRQSQLLWSAGGSVFALIGDVRPEELFEMARSTQ